MYVSCPGTSYGRELSNATATNAHGVLGEIVRAYCPKCETHHWFTVKHNPRQSRKPRQ